VLQHNDAQRFNGCALVRPQVETASAEVARAHATLEEVRTGGKHTTQRQLDAAQAELREAAAAVEAAREAHDQVGARWGSQNSLTNAA
jgi:hypothetical protein